MGDRGTDYQNCWLIHRSRRWDGRIRKSARFPSLIPRNQVMWVGLILRNTPIMSLLMALAAADEHQPIRFSVRRHSVDKDVTSALTALRQNQSDQNLERFYALLPWSRPVRWAEDYFPVWPSPCQLSTTIYQVNQEIKVRQRAIKTAKSVEGLVEVATSYTKACWCLWSISVQALEKWFQ